MTHPYWTVATIATGLVALSLIGFIYCATAWARAKWRLANLQIQQALATLANADLEVEHEQLLAEHRDHD